MSTIPRIVADFEVQLASAISVGATSFTISSVKDDDGNTIPNGTYCFTLDNGASNKEYLIGDIVGTAVSNVRSVSRQGVETTGASQQHRVGASCILTDFVAIQRVSDILRGVNYLDGTSPISYDSTPTLSDGKQLATVAYVLSVVTGGTVKFDSQILQGTAGETVATPNIAYFKEADGRWWKSSAASSSTFDQLKLGVIQSSAVAGGGVSVQISGIATGFTSLVVGTKYYLSDTSGGVSSTPGTTSVFIGWAVSSSSILLSFQSLYIPSKNEKDALAGNFGTPSSTNKFVTELGLFSFGDGSDGDLTIAFGNTVTLTRDTYYNNLTINGTLNTAGFRVFVKGTVSGTGTLMAPTGNAGGAGGNTASGTAGTGGTGAAAFTTGSFLNIGGGNGGAGGNSGSANGSAGSAGPTATIALTSATGAAGGAGTQGGTTGGNPVRGSGGSGGTVTAVDTTVGKFAFQTLNLIALTQSGVTPILSVTGGAGGGGGAAGYTNPNYLGGGGGGGGGASGVPVFLVALNWAGTFTIQSLGGAGGAGGSGQIGPGGQGGGGAGGPAIVIYGSKTWSGSYNLAGGAGANNGATGVSYEVAAKNLIH